MSSYICHHGIKGMRWGVRRYQNSDGSLTAEGRKKYGSVEKFKSSSVYKKTQKTINKTFNKSDKKNTTTVLSEYANERDKVFLNASKRVKSKNPRIGTIFLMSNGRMATSQNVESEIQKGSHIQQINYLNYGKDINETTSMMDISLKYGHQSDLKKVAEKYSNKYAGAYLKDIGESDTAEGRAYLKTLGIV